MEENIEKKYSNGAITILWKPALCTHSKNCWNYKVGLPEVFNPKQRPWINMANAGSERIVEQVGRCPSGALTVYYNNTTDTD